MVVCQYPFSVCLHRPEVIQNLLNRKDVHLKKASADNILSAFPLLLEWGLAQTIDQLR